MRVAGLFERLGANLASARRSQRTVAVGLTFGFVFTAWLGLSVLKYPTSAPSFWFASSFLVCLLLSLEGRLRVVSAAVCLASVILLARLAGWGWGEAAPLAILTGLESLMAAALMRRLSRTPRLQSMKQAGRILTFVILPTTIASSLVAASLAQLIYHRGFITIGEQWLAGHGVGMMLMFPTLMLLGTPMRKIAPGKTALEKVVWAAVLTFFAVGVFTKLSVVTFILILPLATAMAFRLGPKPTVLVLLVLTTGSAIMAHLYPNPKVWGPVLPMETIIFIGQAYQLGVYLNGLFTGLAINHQARVKLQLERRTAASRKARLRAQRASRAKSEFLATMSHEIRTPLNGVLGFAQVLLRREGLEPQVREQIELIGSSGQALLTVVNDILDFSKVEAGQVVLDPRPSRLAAVARESIAIVRAEADRKGLALNLEVDGPDDVLHTVDDQRLRQILINLLNNAVKFTAEGAVTLRLRITPDAVRFEVTDTGVGIAPEALPRLFQRFSQADGSITRSHGGTGLGLAISKGLVELMDGQIGVTSTFGQGSTFWIDMAPPSAAALNDEAAEAVDEEDVSAHILLVDDHPVNRQLGVTVLNLLGCTVDTAENGEQAVQAMRSGRYDLVLMDVHMPVMDGLDATRAIRALGGPASRTPIITMSADVLPEQVARCEAAGMNDRVAKPLSITDLQACLVRWIGRGADGDVLAA